MASTVIRGAQIKDSTVQRHDLDTSTVGQAVVTKLVQGSGITLSSTGADSGTGDVTVAAAPAVSTDAGNIATLGSDNLILVPQSQIWSVRLRSFNAVGNPTFEVDQRNAGATNTLASGANGAWTMDRWFTNKTGTMTGTTKQVAPLTVPDGVIPGLNFRITKALANTTVTTQQASLGTGDFWILSTNIEGPTFRELDNDVHSVSLLVRTSVAGLKFGLTLRDPPTSTKSLSKLCTIPNANTWTLITLPNLPVWPSGFSVSVGTAAYQLIICLAAGSAQTNPANDTWQLSGAGLFGAVGQDNFFSKPVNSSFDAAFVQHEPGALCTTPIDCPFTQNYDACLRYYTKSCGYGVAPGAISSLGDIWINTGANQHAYGPFAFKKIMAKAPTINVWSPITGAANNVRDPGSSTDRAVSGLVDIGDSGFAGCTLTTPNTSATSYRFHYTADTGW